MLFKKSYCRSSQLSIGQKSVNTLFVLAIMPSSGHYPLIVAINLTNDITLVARRPYLRQETICCHQITRHYGDGEHRWR